MKSNPKNIIHIMLLLTISSLCLSCNKNDMSNNNADVNSIAKNILDDAYTAWNSPKAEVQEHMSDYVLVDSADDFLHYTDQKSEAKLSYAFVDNCLRATVAIVPKSSKDIFISYLEQYEYLGETSSKSVYYNTSDNTMYFSYDIESAEKEYSVLGFTPIVSDLYSGDISIKVDYKNLYYTIDGKQFKMILVEGGNLPAFYMMQTEVPLSGEFKIGDTVIGKIDTNNDKCIILAELRGFVNRLNEATGLEFRLPTENEWKFAAKGGTMSNNYTYSGSNKINDVAWYSGNCTGVQDIALKQPNELGFYDMSGNYAEVCSSDPLNIDGKTYGGCWKHTASQCTTTSYVSGNTSTDTIPGTSIREKNAVDGKYISVRLVYSSPE